MRACTDALRIGVKELLGEGYRLWEETPLPKLTTEERNRYVDLAGMVWDGPDQLHFAAVCQSFYLFRKLHREMGEYQAYSVLLGDLFFSLFSKNLIPLDSVPLTDAFAAYLDRDTAGMAEDYAAFILTLPAVIAS